MKIYKQHLTKLSNYSSILMSVLAINGKVYSYDQDYITDLRNNNTNSYKEGLSLRTAHTNLGESNHISRTHQRYHSSVSTYSTSTDEAPVLSSVPKSGKNDFLSCRTRILNNFIPSEKRKVSDESHHLSHSYATSERKEENETDTSSYKPRNSWSPSLKTKEVVHYTAKNDLTSPHRILSNDVISPQTTFPIKDHSFTKGPNEIWDEKDYALYAYRSKRKEKDNH